MAANRYANEGRARAAERKVVLCLITEFSSSVPGQHLRRDWLAGDTLAECESLAAKLVATLIERGYIYVDEFFEAEVSLEEVETLA